MVKYHFVLEKGNACGRPGRVITDKVQYVTCLNCRRTPEFVAAMIELKAQKEAAFEAQTPRKFSEPWHQGNVPMVCKSCGNDTFREADRTCYGHYANYVCAACGGTESRLTETGMSF